MASARQEATVFFGTYSARFDSGIIFPNSDFHFDGWLRFGLMGIGERDDPGEDTAVPIRQ
jgi:hypothetical protein